MKSLSLKLKKENKEFLNELSKSYTIKIFTTRNKILTSKWVIKNGLENFIEDITDVKSLNFLYIDDRCIRFNGEYSFLLDEISRYKPWYKN